MLPWVIHRYHPHYHLEEYHVSSGEQCVITNILLLNHHAICLTLQSSNPALKRILTLNFTHRHRFFYFSYFYFTPSLPGHKSDRKLRIERPYPNVVLSIWNFSTVSYKWQIIFRRLKLHGTFLKFQQPNIFHLLRKFPPFQFNLCIASYSAGWVGWMALRWL